MIQGRIASLTLLATSALLAAPAAAFDPWQDEARYEFVYRIDVASIAAADGQRVSLWIPLAAETVDQQLLDSTVEAPFAVEERTDGLGNRMAHVTWEGRAPEGSVLSATLQVVRRPSTGLSSASIRDGSRDDPKRFLGARKRVPLDGLIDV